LFPRGNIITALKARNGGGTNPAKLFPLRGGDGRPGPSMLCPGITGNTEELNHFNVFGPKIGPHPTETIFGCCG